jgi:hypothetical protein
MQPSSTLRRRQYRPPMRGRYSSASRSRNTSSFVRPQSCRRPIRVHHRLLVTVRMQGICEIFPPLDELPSLSAFLPGLQSRGQCPDQGVHEVSIIDSSAPTKGDALTALRTRLH